MKLQNQSGGSSPKKAPSRAAGTENPATSQHVDVGVKHKTSMPVAAMAGSLSRKIPGEVKAGQKIAGKASKVAESFTKGKKLTKSLGGRR